MADSEEEPDYLSDEFLASCIPKDDVRPGLLNRHAEKRKHEQLKQQERINEEHRKKHKSFQQLQEEGRNEGLNRALGADNKGFQMLQKMGFKPGTSIGLNRSDQTSSSSPSGNGDTGILASSSSIRTTIPLKEPIPIVIKVDKKGLGGKTKMEEKRAKLQEWNEYRNRMSDTNEFRNRVRDQVSIKEINSDLRKAQSATKNLDLQHDKAEPCDIWFWPEVPKEKNEEDDDDDEHEIIDDDEIKLEPLEKLRAITCYLRSEYYYCIWCGSSYDDEEDLKTSCPGNSRQDH